MDRRAQHVSEPQSTQHRATVCDVRVQTSSADRVIFSAPFSPSDNAILTYVLS